MEKKYSKIVKVKGKTFRYDFENMIVEYVWVVDEDMEDLGLHKGDIEVLDAAGLKRENWTRKNCREEYLGEWCAELDEEARWLAL